MTKAGYSTVTMEKKKKQKPSEECHLKSDENCQLIGKEAEEIERAKYFSVFYFFFSAYSFG